MRLHFALAPARAATRAPTPGLVRRVAVVLVAGGLLAACGGGGSEPGPDLLVAPLDGGADAAIEPHPHVARVGVPDSFRPRPGGAYALGTGDELFDVGRAFYRTHPDDYDVLVVFTDFPVADLFAFSIPLRHDIRGIGLDEAIARYGWQGYSPASAGSAGRLQHIVLMNSPSTYRASRYTAQEILTHEFGHRFSAYIALGAATDRLVLVDRFTSHWTVYAGVGGASALGYGQLTDRGGGSFAFEIVQPLRYSRLELYQQGLLAAGGVGPLFYVESPSGFEPPASRVGPWDADSYGEDVRFTGTRRDFDITDVVRTHGERVPSEGQRAWRMAFVVVCVEPASCPPATLTFVDQQRAAWERTYPEATGERATVDTLLRK